MFRSLRAKLIISYAAIIILTLLLASTAITFLLHSYQTQLRLNQLADVALPLASNVRFMDRAGASKDDVRQYLKDQASYLNVRILLITADRKVSLDTDDDLVGQVLPAPSAERNRNTGIMQWGILAANGRPPLAFVSAELRPDRIGGPGRGGGVDRTPPAQLVIAIPQERITAAWLTMAPILLASAAAALVVAIAVAMVLARSIARPLAQLTRASERMAKGDFDQYIHAPGRDEVAQLASSFNTMAHEVGQTHQTMRDFLANVSHELRTPLTSIEGFAQAMRDGTIQDPEQYHDAARIIGEEADRMHRLVEDLLYLSKIESGQIDLLRARLDLAELLRGCVQQVQPQIDSAGVNVGFDAVEVPPVLADEHRLQQVFVNLLDNAIKHTPITGSIEVRAYPLPRHGHGNGRGAGQRADPGAPRWVAVDVFNSGSYIPEGDRARIFERFYQVDRSRAGNAGGSGLGLAIVREIVQAHRGKVEVTSDPQHGTTFTVVLPAA